MKSLWNDREVKKFKGDLLKLRVYTSRLLGQQPDLVLHGGGNTSVKMTVKDIFGEAQDVLYIKASGWDLATIEAEGFAAVKLDVLKRMAQLKQLSDAEMVKQQRVAMIDPHAPNPSVEAILHAIIPFKFVDHTHADSVVTITNTPDGEKRIREVYGERVLIVPYVMPGFILAKKVYEMTKDFTWEKMEGIILMNHGVFTFHDDARTSYERMIKAVSKAEHYLKMAGSGRDGRPEQPVEYRWKPPEDLLGLARIRQTVSKIKGSAMLAKSNQDDTSRRFSSLANVASLATRGPLTPDHVIRTKPRAAVLGKKPLRDIQRFARDYKEYFQRHNDGSQISLDPAPRWALWPGHGLLSFGTTVKEVEMVSDIIQHTIRAIQQAQALGGWKPLANRDIFEIEYWELEQAKIKKGTSPLTFQGKIALVTGAASGIGRTCVEAFHAQGASVVALDMNPAVENLFRRRGVVGMICDVTKKENVKRAVEATVRHFGGIDILISNAGIFPPSENIVDMQSETWNKSLAVNLSSHRLLLKECIPYLALGIEPAVVIIGSKNVPAPGPGAGAYSVAKAGLTQLARVAALELSTKGIRVNVIHPNQVFDTAIWTPEVLKKRARHYAMSVEEYKSHNLLRLEITSKDVAALACVLAGPIFAKTTGAQIPIDGGNDRVI